MAEDIISINSLYSINFVLFAFDPFILIIQFQSFNSHASKAA